MNRQLVLSSYDVKNTNGNKPGDFTIKYTNPIILDSNKQYEIGLDRIISMSFTWFNLTKELNNQKIRYSSDSGSNWTELTFQPGVWNYVDFNDYIKGETQTGTASNPSFSITLEFNDSIFRVIITLAQNYQLDLTKSNFNNLIGFNKKILTASVNEGDYIPNLSQDREILNIHCDLISDSLVDGNETDIIYSFSTSTLTLNETRNITSDSLNFVEHVGDDNMVHKVYKRVKYLKTKPNSQNLQSIEVQDSKTKTCNWVVSTSFSASSSSKRTPWCKEDEDTILAAFEDFDKCPSKATIMETFKNEPTLKELEWCYEKVKNLFKRKTT